MTLIARACRVASRCLLVTRTVVSSDDAEMGAEGLRNGAQRFIRRPTHLATDSATGAEAWRHAWMEAEREWGEDFDVSVLLQPTSPMRTISDVATTIELLLRSGASASVTVSPVPKHFIPKKLLRLTTAGAIAPFVDGSVPNQPRQDLPDAYWLNGHCYAARRDAFLRTGVVLPQDTVAHVIERPVVNVDEPEDLELASWILARHGDVVGDEL